MPQNIVCGVVIAIMVLAASSLPASAQINPFGRSDFELSPEDGALLKAAAAKLYEGETAPLGAIEEWFGAKSGDRGTVELIRIFEHKGLACRRLQHDITLAKVAGPFRFIIDRCQVSPGVWKIL